MFYAIKVYFVMYSLAAASQPEGGGDKGGGEQEQEAGADQAKGDSGETEGEGVHWR